MILTTKVIVVQVVVDFSFSPFSQCLEQVAQGFFIKIYSSCSFRKQLEEFQKVSLEGRKITWIFFFPVKYHHVGKLLKEGEEPTVYSDEDEKDARDAKKE